MNFHDSQFTALERAADPAVATAIAELIRDGADRDLNRINALDFAAAARAGRAGGDLRLPACVAARPVRPDLERAVSRLQRRARRPRHAEIAARRRLPLRAVRLQLRGLGRPAGRGGLHRGAADPPDRRARARYAAVVGVFPADVLELGGRFQRGRICDAERRDHPGCGGVAGRRDRDATARSAGAIPDRVRSGDAHGAVHRRAGRADRRACSSCRWCSIARRSRTRR